MITRGLGGHRKHVEVGKPSRKAVGTGGERQRQGKRSVTEQFEAKTQPGPHDSITTKII